MRFKSIALIGLAMGCSTPDSTRCDNSCTFANDGVCDDGRPGAPWSVCDYGSDCADCEGTGGTGTSVECPEERCSGYTSQAAAQRDLDSYPVACTSLDADDDGEACEENGNGWTICPDSAACGCSDLNMDECNTVCCSWTVGEGCGCR